MALAQRHAGVTQGYRVKVKRVERTEPAWMVVAWGNVKSSARELRELVRDEIAYATMDTMRVLEYLKYELGFRERKKPAPVVREREAMYAVETLQAEPVGVMAKRQVQAKN